MIGAREFVVLADASAQWPSAAYRLFEAVACEHPVLWVELPPPEHGHRVVTAMARGLGTDERGERPETASTGRAPSPIAMARRLARRLGRTTLPRSGLLRYTPPIPLAENDGWVGRAAMATVSRLISRRMRAAEFGRPLLVVTTTRAARLVETLEGCGTIYVRPDDALPPSPDRIPAERAARDRLLSRVDSMVTCCPEVADARARGGVPVLTLPQGVDARVFEDATAPPEAARDGRPRVLYVGPYDRRVDVVGLLALARARPELEIVLAGPRSVRSNALDRRPNVRVFPEVRAEDAAGWVLTADALLLPIRDNRHLRAFRPLELPLYAASGRPIAGSPLPALEQLVPAQAEVGRGPAGFVAAVDRALARGPAKPLQASHWEALAARLCQQVEPLFEGDD